MAIANLLGVAGTDVPIRDIKKLMMPFTVNSKHFTIFDSNVSTFFQFVCHLNLWIAWCQWICVHSQ